MAKTLRYHKLAGKKLHHAWKLVGPLVIICNLVTSVSSFRLMNIPLKKLLNILLFVPFCYLFSLIPVPLLDPFDKPDLFHSHSEATRGGYMSQISSRIGKRIQQKLKSAYTKQSFGVISIQRYFCFSSVFVP